MRGWRIGIRCKRVRANSSSRWASPLRAPLRRCSEADKGLTPLERNLLFMRSADTRDYESANTLVCVPGIGPPPRAADRRGGNECAVATVGRKSGDQQRPWRQREAIDGFIGAKASSRPPKVIVSRVSLRYSICDATPDETEPSAAPVRVVSRVVHAIAARSPCEVLLDELSPASL
jgi:hypothetical protein